MVAVIIPLRALIGGLLGKGRGQTICWRGMMDATTYAALLLLVWLTITHVKLVSGEPKIDGTILLNLARQAQGPILELGCGYGRITIPLAQRGVQDRTGLELSAPPLAYGRQQAADLPIQWVEADVRDFHLNRRYPFIFARGDVFNFMLTRIDQEAMLARVHESG